jgi:hypothetical protein
MLKTFGFSEELTHCNTLVRCGGSMEGMLTVFEKGFSDVPDFDLDLSEYLEGVLVRHPVAPPTVDSFTFKKQTWYKLFENVTVNAKSRAGHPFEAGQLSDDKTVLLALLDSETIYDFFYKQKMTADEVFDLLVDAKPELLTLRLQNKIDTYKKENLLTKTRPYYIFPIALKLFIMAFSQNFKTSVGFWETEKECAQSSECMLGFSWMHGGAERLFTRMVNAAPGELHIHSYSDDSTVYVIDGGVIKHVAIDCSHMDASHRKCHMDLKDKYDEHRIRMYGGNDVDVEVYRFINKCALVNLVNSTTSDIFLKRWGLSSGHPETTNYNAVVSAAASELLHREWKEGKFTFETFEDFVDLMPHLLREKMGLVVKASRDSVVTSPRFLNPGMVFKIGFLSQNIGCVEMGPERVIVPFPSTNKLASSYAFSYVPAKGPEMWDQKMGQKIGICITGGFYYPTFYKMLSSDYNGLITARASIKGFSAKEKVFNMGEMGEIFGEAAHAYDYNELYRHDWSTSFAPWEFYVRLFQEKPQWGEEVKRAPPPVSGTRKAKLSLKSIATTTAGKARPAKTPAQQEEQERKEKARALFNKVRTETHKSSEVTKTPEKAPTAEKVQKPTKSERKDEKKKEGIAQKAKPQPDPKADASVEKYRRAGVRMDIYNKLPRERGDMPPHLNEEDVNDALRFMLANESIVLVEGIYHRKKDAPQKNEISVNPNVLMTQHPTPKDIVVAFKEANVSANSPAPKVANPPSKRPEYKGRTFKSLDDAFEYFIELVEAGHADTKTLLKVFGARFKDIRKRAKEAGYVYKEGRGFFEE